LVLRVDNPPFYGSRWTPFVSLRLVWMIPLVFLRDTEGV